MTWHETHERLRILREVEATAAADMSGRLPWRESWSGSFGDRAGLLVALRERWDRMCDVQLDELTSPERVRETERRLRRTHAGVLRILESHGLVGLPEGRGPAPPLEAA
ncbi:hypothetical protein [Nocardioides sp.]|uniref:hypothetical protein n=1 Tax=Nocardioides sp. TaxID=35761 RepID=UPI001A354DFA|nr:hypothetical protein [Nocardioides sp.]MBJ7358215.1 hypothetical protein [Nocardioides sp.]